MRGAVQAGRFGAVLVPVAMGTSCIFGGERFEDARSTCDAYVDCAGVVDPALLPSLLAGYGDDSPCWEDADSAETCAAGCRSLIAGTGGALAFEADVPAECEVAYASVGYPFALIWTELDWVIELTGPSPGTTGIEAEWRILTRPRDAETFYLYVVEEPYAGNSVFDQLGCTLEASFQSFQCEDLVGNNDLIDGGSGTVTGLDPLGLAITLTSGARTDTATCTLDPTP
jgi:hypothetical protein